MDSTRTNNSSTEGSPLASADLSLTADTTPSPDEEYSIDRNEDLPAKKRKKKNTSQLEKLIADHDWYVTFEPDSKRSSSIKRQTQRLEGLSYTGVEQEELTEEEKAKKLETKLKAQLKRQATLERKRQDAIEKKEQRRKLQLLGIKPTPKKPSGTNNELKLVMEGATWFNRDSNIDSYTRKIKPKTEWFIIEDEPVKKHIKKRAVTPKTKEEDSRLKSRGQNKRSNNLKKNKKTVKKTKVTKVKKETKEGLSNTPEVEEVEEVVEEEQFNWFLDLDDDELVPIGDRKVFIDEVYQNKLIETDYVNLDDDSSENLVSASYLICHFKNHYTNNEKFPYTEVSLSTLFSNYKEHYILSLPKDDELNPFVEIGTNMEIMAVLFLPEEHRLKIRNDENPEDSIVGRYIKAFSEENINAVLAEIDSYNKLIEKLRQDKDFLIHLQKLKYVSKTVFHEILNQSYSRTVSPNVQTLRSYKAFSNEVYGELLPSFLSTVYKKTGLDHSKTFMDLGSGVGNCVLQAALEYGCVSYGCEIMKNASKLSDLQLREFKKRCKIFGFRPGNVHNFLEQSFVDNEQVKKAVNECDIILCNNYLFDADLNSKLVELFRNLKTGTQIITLKPIVPLGYSFNALDVECILNRLKMEKFTYGNNSVSWTNNGGVYYISEVQEDIVSEYFVEHAKGRTSRTRTR